MSLAAALVYPGSTPRSTMSSSRGKIKVPGRVLKGGEGVPDVLAASCLTSLRRHHPMSQPCSNPIAIMTTAM
eukprot:CAMPEP_0114316398 /NCGR_PEP_ID=MMETSP0059-20121206/23178_1 /TAXON_ID=36894 /ORGANISM="Pyramimonas parkeae, Strain CCMP726" /LENGTH=71 /DNA_ID=CAMNT_0001442319 /DNA_START=168 /DNA_END=383 /DNA_ORIENTATION=+